LAKLVEKTGLARSSVMMHLKHLEEQSPGLQRRDSARLGWQAEDALQALAQTAGEGRPD
jgi:hypothetical protein